MKDLRLIAIGLGFALGPFGAISAQAADDGKLDGFKRWAAFYKTIRTDLRSDDYRRQLAAMEKFAGQDYPEAADYLIDSIERERLPALILRKAADVLGSFKHPGTRKKISAALAKRPGANRYLLIAFGAQEHKPGHGGGNALAVEALTKARSPATQSAAIDAIALTPKQAPETVAALVEFLDPKYYHTVRRAAAKALGKIESADAVVPLIEALDDRLLAENARDSLLRLTGRDHWTDAATWRTWWQSAAAGFEPNPLDDAAFEKRRGQLLVKHGDRTGGPMMAEFYGKKLQGKYLLFLLDASGSMEEGGRMERLKHELNLMIEQMAEEFRFGFVMFPLNTFPARGIEPAEKRFKDRALRFVDRLTPGGGTPMGEALQVAFEQVVTKENVDTIYLLSDGEPTDMVPDFLQDYILEMNEPLGVTIHTIWLGGEGSELLKKIAEQNGGQFWEAP